jgi:hypothetical protein
MRPELAVPGAFALAALIAFVATPVAIRVARATSFFDLPVGYKGHRSPTPYLGGAAVIAGLLVGAFAFGGDLGTGLGLIIALAVVMWVLGTIDDRVNLPLVTRVVIEISVGGLLWATGHGCDERVQPDGQHGRHGRDDGCRFGAWRRHACVGRRADASRRPLLRGRRLMRRLPAAQPGWPGTDLHG